VQVPHEVTVREVLQLSLAVTLPQFLPRRVQNAVSVSGAQAVPHTLAVPPPAHVAGEVHVPHEATVRETLQLSAAVTLPQFLLRRVQNAASVSAVQPQTLAVPPPAQVLGEVQAPQLRVPPQASLIEPQFLPWAVHVVLVQPQTLAVPPPAQVLGEVHVPHEATVREVLQLSLAVTLPQLLPRRVQNAASVSAVQTHCCDALQVAGEVQVPQLALHPSLPHCLPVQFGVQAVAPHTLAVPPPAQVLGEVQVPHEVTVFDVLQLFVLVRLPQFLPHRAHSWASVSAVQVPPPEPQVPLSVQTVPQGQPVAPGAQGSLPAQLAQLPLAQVQFLPPLETFVPVTYVLQLALA
jgi:hypothetical protein